LNALGKHLLLELNDCDRLLLNDLDAVREIMLAAASESGVTVLGESFHRFSPQGVSGVLIIAESHFTIHTWPEHGYAAADIFTCGNTVQPEKAAEVIIERFNPGSHSIVQMFRGMVEVKEKVAR
jgi:S-adenosylmethionine decarboxylase proenzyme